MLLYLFYLLVFTLKFKLSGFIQNGFSAFLEITERGENRVNCVKKFNHVD